MIDTHCHLFDAKYDRSAEEVARNFFASNGEFLIDIACDTCEFENAKKLANSIENVYYAVGIHPEYVENAQIEILESFLENVDKKLVAIGEIGLDYHYSTENKKEQKELFEKQIILAKKCHLPIIIHCRDAYGDTLDIVKKYAPYEDGGVFHCFGGSWEFCEEILKLGFYVSFAGNLTYKNSLQAHNVASKVPLDKVLTETDSPYLSPNCHRGEVNEPKNVQDVLQYLADLKNVSAVEMNKIIKQNAKCLFKKITT